jgi:hypothetical protein
VEKYRVVKRQWHARMSIMFLLIVAVGCGRQEVSYEDSSVGDNQAVESNTEEGAGTLRASLGIDEEENWKEDFELGEISSHVNAKVYVPEASQMYTQEVSEYYYTAEDKKNIVEYFFDSDSIKVDMDMVPTKDVLLESIQLCEACIAEQESDAEEWINMISQEQQRLQTLLVDAPDKEEIEESPGDYSEDYYIGMRDGVEYGLAFEISRENNRSGWQLQAKEEYWNEFNTLGEDCLAAWIVLDAEEDNKCNLKEAEAVRQAEKICEELGFAGLKTVRVDSILWQKFQNEDFQLENNGYRIVLQREIGGLFVQAENYSSEKYFDAETMERSYDMERVAVWLNDRGIFRISCKGIMSADESAKPAKLLDFAQIKEMFAQHILTFSGNNTSTRWKWIGLEYVRLCDEQNKDVYSYVPAWRFCENIENEDYYIDHNIWINAIDGSLINMEQQGAVSYHTAEMDTGIDANGVEVNAAYNVQEWD